MRELKEADSNVELEEFEVSMDFEGEIDFEEITEVQRSIEERRYDRAEFRGVRFLDYRISQPVERAPRSILARLFPPMPQPEKVYSKIVVRIVLAPRD